MTEDEELEECDHPFSYPYYDEGVWRCDICREITGDLDDEEE